MTLSAVLSLKWEIDVFVCIFIFVKITKFMPMQGLFSEEILRDLLIFLPKVSMKLALKGQNLIANCNLANNFAKISR